MAKGVDAVAARIREVAEANRVPLVANPPLARALHRVELDTEIPAEHFQAVAEIIAYVWRLRGAGAWFGRAVKRRVARDSEWTAFRQNENRWRRRPAMPVCAMPNSARASQTVAKWSCWTKPIAPERCS